MKNHKIFWTLISVYTICMLSLNWYKPFWFMVFSASVAALFAGYMIRFLVLDLKETEDKIRRHYGPPSAADQRRGT